MLYHYSRCIYHAPLILYIYIYIYSAERYIDLSSSPYKLKVINDFTSSIASGLGYGLMNTIITYGAIIGASSADATWYRDECPNINAFMQIAITALFRTNQPCPFRGTEPAPPAGGGTNPETRRPPLCGGHAQIFSLICLLLLSFQN